MIHRIEGLYKAASFSNLLIFLLTGRYVSKLHAVALVVFQNFSNKGFLLPNPKHTLNDHFLLVRMYCIKANKYM